MSGLKRKAARVLFHRVLHADDTPHQIALGAAIGTFVAFTPTMGFQTVIALGIAAALRANKVVCIPLVWLTNPLTSVPIYWFCWTVGAWVLPGGNSAHATDVLHRMTRAAESITWSGFFQWSFWIRAGRFMLDLGAELWVGSMIVGVVFGAAAYGLAAWGVSTYRRRREARRMRFDIGGAKRFIVPTAPPTTACVRQSA